MPGVTDGGGSTGGWSLRPAAEADVDSLMGWFDSAGEVRLWGGPTFRYPFTPVSFRADCHWPAMASYALCDPAAEFRAFGQYYPYRRHIHLARLVVRPDSRGAGLGRRLVSLLIEAGQAALALPASSLFVFRDNLTALNCYRALGFQIATFPADRADFSDSCYYLTRVNH